MPRGCFQRKRALETEHQAGEVARVVARAKEGDEGAIRFLYERYADNVYSYARSIVRDEHDAEDITQHVFTRLLTAIQSYEQRSVPFSGWLMRITHNAAVDHMRRRTLPAMVELESASLESRGVAPLDDHRGELLEALAELPESQREVVLLRHLGGYSPGEIACRLGRSEDSIHGLHHRGRRALRTALTRSGAMPATLAA
jgi:RNA polymerase sigma-70 factor (ECF subfamily)